jgi:hypothetical protein
VDLLAEVLPFLVALYLVDSALLVREGQLLLASGWQGRFSARGPGLRWPGLLPTAEAFLAAGLPLRPTPDGLLVPDGRGAERLVRFDAMEPVTVGAGAVRLDRRTELAVRPRSAAPEVARVVEALRRAPRERRLEELRDQLRRRCDERALAGLRRRQLRHARTLKALSVASFAALFLLVPASLVPALAWRPSPLAAIAVALALWAATLAVSVVMLRDCGLGRGRVASALLPLLLFPPAAAHAGAIVARELYLGFEPLALARLLLAPADLDLVARRPAAAPPAAGESWDLAALVREQLGDRVPRPAPPAPADGTAAAYCPSCLAQYRAGFSRCSDCDAPLEPYAR